MLDDGDVATIVAASETASLSGSRIETDADRSAQAEATFWQVYASENDTTVSFGADPMVVGLPGPSVTLAAGQIQEFFVSAPVGIEADFTVNADKPVAVVGYMTSSENVGSDIGDPAMAQFVPSEQFLPRYVVLVPGTWVNDTFVRDDLAGVRRATCASRESSAEVGSGTDRSVPRPRHSRYNSGIRECRYGFSIPRTSTCWISAAFGCGAI